MYTTFDFHLKNDSTLLIAHFDEERTKKGVVEIYDNRAELVRRANLDISINWDEYNGIKIIDFQEELCVFVLTGYGVDDYGSLVFYNIETGKYSLYDMALGYQGDGFIGEGIAIWSEGVVYKYDEATNTIYAMLTDKEYIRMFKYDLNDLPKAN